MSRRISETAKLRLQLIQEFAHFNSYGLVIEKIFDDKDIQWLNDNKQWSVYGGKSTTKNIKLVGRTLWRFVGRNITIQSYFNNEIVADITNEEFIYLKTSDLKSYKI